MDRAQSVEISVDTFDLTEKLFDRYLFPDLSMPSDEAIVPRIPVMHNQTRIELYNILTLLVKDDRNYFKVVDHLEDIIPQGMNPYQYLLFVFLRLTGFSQITRTHKPGLLIVKE